MNFLLSLLPKLMNKRVIGMIIVFSLIAGVFGYIYALKQDINVLKSDVVSLHKEVASLETQNNQYASTIDFQNEEIERLYDESINAKKNLEDAAKNALLIKKKYDKVYNELRLQDVPKDCLAANKWLIEKSENELQW